MSPAAPGHSRLAHTATPPGDSVALPLSPVAPWILAQTAQLLQQPGHALLLHGPSGLGQFDLALELTRAWLCERPGPVGACHACASCHAVDVQAHGDLFVLMPETVLLELGWPLGEKAQSEIDDKKRKASKEIRIDAMRDALEFSQRTSGSDQGKMVLVYPAERMNSTTANALLKTLEEPPGSVRFVLASEAAYQLLPTIRSRCQAHSMAWPEEGDAIAWLLARGVSPDVAGTVLRASGERPRDALRLASAAQAGIRWQSIPKALHQGDDSALQKLSAAELIDLLQKICHDLQLRAVGAQPRFFALHDLPSPAPLPVLSDWGKELSRARRTAEHPFNPGLMSEALLDRAKNALNSRC